MTGVSFCLDSDPKSQQEKCVEHDLIMADGKKLLCFYFSLKYILTLKLETETFEIIIIPLN